MAEGADLPFVFTPAHRISPLVISVPHAGLEWPDDLGRRPNVSFPRNADHGVDRLYAFAPGLGAATVCARYSRLVLDLNRPHDDISPELVPDHPAPRPRPLPDAILKAMGVRRSPPKNRGVVWSVALGNVPLVDRLSYQQFCQRLERFYFPYYRALKCLLDRRVRRFGHAVLLDGHSMPSVVGHDLVLGTRRGHSCTAELSETARFALAPRVRGSGPREGARSWPPLSLMVDQPYEGGNIVRELGCPEGGVQALQLEISRHLYMDEKRLQLWPLRRPGSATRAQPYDAGAEALRCGLRRLVDRLVAWTPRTTRTT